MSKNYKKEFSPETWMLLSSDSVKQFQNLEDEILLYQFSMLQNGIEKSPIDYLNTQLRQAGTVTKGIVGIINNRKENIKKALQKAYDEATAIAEDKLNISNSDKPITIRPDTPADENLDLVSTNLKLLQTNHVRASTGIPAQIYANLMLNPNHTTWTMEEHLKEYHKAIETAYKRSLPNMTAVQYSNGRKVSFKSYIETAIRTSVNNVAVDMLTEGAKGAGLVLFLCSSLSDSAPDHADLQGRIYILSDWRQIVPKDDYAKYEELIDSKKIQTIEWAKYEATYTTDTGKTYIAGLGVRCNCRHTFTPITYEQATGSTEALLEKLGNKSVDSYDKDRYVQTQKLRSMECKLREAKLNYANKLVEMRKSKSEQDVMSLNAQADALHKKVLDGQKKIREHIANYSYLDRQYDRENPSIVKTSLGVKK